MLLKQTHYALGNSGNIPWWIIILAVLVIGGVGYLIYQAKQSPKIIPSPKKNVNEQA